jgi:uncharacterized membrane protein
MELEVCLIAVALAMSLWLRPWRMLSRQALEKDGPSEPSPLVTPLLATLVVLPWLWALPTLHRMPLQLQWSGACLVVLMLGWPLAIPALVAVGGIAAVLSPSLDLADAVGTIAWQGVVPATLALALGAVIRRLIGTQPFVYVLCRAFLGTAVCLFLANVLGQWSGHSLPGVEGDLSLVARWLMAWGDAFVTGMLTAIFVAFKLEWLATWSDRLYLRKPD